MATTPPTAAQRRMIAMAIDRQGYINAIEHRLTGAVVEYYKATIAASIGQTQWVQHWTTEWRRLLNELIGDLLRPSKGWKNQRKAAMTALSNFRAGDAKYQAAAQRIVKRDYGLAKLPPPPSEADVDRFYVLAQERVDDALPE